MNSTLTVPLEINENGTMVAVSYHRPYVVSNSTLDPDELLDQHQHLLKIGDEDLNKYSTLNRQLWMTDAETAMKEKMAQQQRIVGHNPDKTKE